MVLQITLQKNMMLLNLLNLDQKLLVAKVVEEEKILLKQADQIKTASKKPSHERQGISREPTTKKSPWRATVLVVWPS